MHTLLPEKFFLSLIRSTLLLLLLGFSYRSGFSTTLSVRLIKDKPSRCSQKPSLVFLSDSSVYHLADHPWYNGENDWEIFFEIETDRQPLPLERIHLFAPGVGIARAIVGRTDLPFVRNGDTIEIQLARDTSDGRHIETSYQNPNGGPHVWFFHNWEARVNGNYLKIPYPATPLAASINYVWACQQLLLQMGDASGLKQSFYGELILLNCESSAPRAHLDYPPHWHLEHWENDYNAEYGIDWRRKQFIIPHYYLDSSGAIVENKQSLTRNYIPVKTQQPPFKKGDTCTWQDREGNLIFRQVIKEDGLYFFKPSGEEWSLRPDPEKGAGEAVWVFKGKEAVARATVKDDGEKGVTNLTIDYYRKGKRTGSWNDSFRYDPFTGNKLDQ